MVTGMSGGGKSTAMRLLEDMGYYCVDNLPIQLIDKFVELLSTPNTEITKVAIGVDVRTDQSFARVEKTLSCLRQNGMVFEVLFMDASDAVLVKRYKESRRMHPLCSAENPRIEDGIEKEREILQQVKKDADYVIDTSKLLTVQPRKSSSLLTSSSRSMFLAIFFTQKSPLFPHSSCGFNTSQSLPWKNSLSQNTAILYFVRTISGFPGSSAQFFRYPYPCCLKTFRRASSIFVSFAWMQRMFSLRCLLTGFCMIGHSPL